jgi:hypothetical protein
LLQRVENSCVEEIDLVVPTKSTTNTPLEWGEADCYQGLFQQLEIALDSAAGNPNIASNRGIVEELP